MRRRTAHLAVFAALVLPASAGAQAIVGYGVNVGRAGAAGAASGAGAAGIFTGLKGGLDKANENEKNKSSEARQVSEQQEREATEPKKEKKDLPTQYTVGPSGEALQQTMGTSGGIRISGLNKRPQRASRPASAGDVSAPEVAAGAPTGKPAASGSKGAEARPTGSTGQSKALGAATKGVLEPRRTRWSGQDDAPEGDLLEEEKLRDLELAEVPEGTPIEDVVKRLGRPLMALTGITGRNYTAKYIFKAPDGARITVLANEGKVVSVFKETERGQTRAAL